MSNVIPFKKRPRKKLGLCQHGHHKWQIDNENKFDSKEGKLVTVFKCSNCGKRKVEGT